MIASFAFEVSKKPRFQCLIKVIALRFLQGDHFDSEAVRAGTWATRLASKGWRISPRKLTTIPAATLAFRTVHLQHLLAAHNGFVIG